MGADSCIEACGYLRLAEVDRRADRGQNSYTCVHKNGTAAGWRMQVIGACAHEGGERA